MPDRPGHGVPSDHMGVCATPKSNQTEFVKQTKVITFIRPLPESLIPTFQHKLSSLNFETLHGLPVPVTVDMFQSALDSILCETFPEKRILVFPHYVQFGKRIKYEAL